MRPRTEAQTLNLYLARSNVIRLDALAARLDVSRSGTIDYLLGLDDDVVKKQRRKKSEEISQISLETLP